MLTNMPDASSMTQSLKDIVDEDVFGGLAELLEDQKLAEDGAWTILRKLLVEGECCIHSATEDP